MDQKDLRLLLESVAKGTVSPEKALLQLKMQPYKELDEACIDTHCAIRQGVAEVLYGAEKTKEQILKIVQATKAEGCPLMLITRLSAEAALTAQAFGNKVTCLYDMGVSGMHRMLSPLEDLMSAQVVITVAGMEGALACVVAGMVSCPVIAVPTSIGYGVSEGGIAALLSMLSSCASRVSVVNIDNGYGAGYIASAINHLPGRSTL